MHGEGVRYDLRVLSLGAGVQSSTVLLMMCEGELEAADVAIFADTQWEPPEVYEWLEGVLEPAARGAGIELVRVTAGDIRADALDPERGFASMPVYVQPLEDTGREGMARRQCTREYKIAPIQSEIMRRLDGDWRGKRVLKTFGISLDEVARMKESRVGYVDHHYPLVFEKEMKRADCRRWLEEHGYGTPPRSACVGCPFHNDAEWRHLRDNQPSAWEDAVDFDRRIRVSSRIKERFDGQAYLHRSLLPLDEVDLRTDEQRGQLNLFQNECEGYCGV